MAQKKPNININKNWSAYEIRRLETLANIGDSQALQELTRYHNRLVRESNFRLRTLDRAGIHKYAYEKAQFKIAQLFGRNTRFKEYRKGNLPTETVRLQIYKMQSFLNMESSTVEGVREIEQRRLEGFRAKYAEESAGMTDEQIEAFLRFLGEKPIRKFLEHIGKVESDHIVDLLRGKFESSSEEEREIIREQIERFMATENAVSMGIKLEEKDKLYYDELQEYLKGDM